MIYNFNRPVSPWEVISMLVHMGTSFSLRRADGPITPPHHGEFIEASVIKTDTNGDGPDCHYVYTVQGPSPTGQKVEYTSKGDMVIFADAGGI